MAEASLITPAMQRAVGTAGEPRTATIERGAILRFAEAIGDPNPAYPDVAPPTFLRSLPVPTASFPDVDTVPRLLDGGSAWTYNTPIRPGDAITVTTVLGSLKEREGRMGAMLIAEHQIEYRNQRGELAATQHTTHIRMKAAG